MTIESRAHRVTALFALVGVLLSIAIGLTNHQMEQTRQELDVLFNIQGTVGELRTVGFEYALYGEARPRIQTEATVRMLRSQLAGVSASTSSRTLEESALWQDVKNSFADCETLLNEQLKSLDLPASDARQRQTIRLFVLHGDSLVSSVNKLVARAVSHDRQTQLVGQAVIVTTIIMLLLLPVVLVMFLRRTILRPLSALTSAVKLVAGGNLTIRLRSDAPGEFGDLARSFDYMLERVQAAQLELQRNQEHLETLVAERTGRLALSEQQFRGAFETASNAMALVSVEGTWLKVNLAVCSLFGFSEQELLNTNFQALTHHDDLPADLSQMKALLDGHIPSYRMEKRYFHRDGHVVWALLSVSLVRDGDGRPVHFVSQIVDITSQKAAEQRVREAQQLAESANLAKSQFLANMSHEIRTPMNAILGMLQLMQHTALDTRQQDYTSKAISATKALLGIINDILDFSKIDAGKMGLDVQPFSVDRLMRDLAVVLSANLVNKNIEILYDIDPGVPAQLVGDSMRLQQILTNLGSNAIKFTTAGHVVISLRRSGADIQPTTGQACIEFMVQDSGIGIAAEDQLRIFSDFSQAESSTTRRFGGTGLGLAISKRLVEMMGSQIMLRSAPGVGSAFSFELHMPIAAALDAPSEKPESIHSALVIDDDELTCTLTAKMLRTAMQQVDVANSAVQAIERVQARAANGLGPYTCVFVDWRMPEMDGWETIRRLIETHHAMAARLPKFVMLSANGRQHLSQRTREEQNLLSAFLVKPVTASMLLEAARSHNADTDTDANAMRRAPRSSKRQLADMRILVVEDNAINQQVAKELLGFEGALVSIASDGWQGVQAIESALVPFDAVLMDVQMPVMDGLAATRAIRQELHQQSLPIIGLTANAMASDREACLNAGMNEHVGKPLEIAQLVSTLILLTGRRPVARDTPSDAAPNPQELQDTVPVINLAAALHRLGGMQALFVSAARQFQPVLASLVQDLNQLLQADDVKHAQSLLHTTKGNSATLGLERLAQALGALDQMCKAGDGAAHIQLAALSLQATTQSARHALEQAIIQLGETRPDDGQTLA